MVSVTEKAVEMMTEALRLGREARSRIEACGTDWLLLRPQVRAFP